MRATIALALVIATLALAPTRAAAGLVADSISVSGDSISRAFNANTGNCNYGDNPARSWATGVDHGSNLCSAGGDGTYSHAERLECLKGASIVEFNDSVSGGDMLSDFKDQATSIRENLSASAGPRNVLVLMGHNDACTNEPSRTGNSCSGDRNPNNYCRTTNAAFEREFRRGMDQLIRIPNARVQVLALIRISQLCNFTGKSSCGLGFGLSCNNVWQTLGAANSVFGSNGVCLSLTSDCSNQRRIDMYDTLVGYNQILSRVTAEYAAIPVGGTSATGATKAEDVEIRYRDGSFNIKLSSSDLSCCDCFHPSDVGHQKLARYAWDGFQCSSGSPCCGSSGTSLGDANCSASDTTTFYPSGFWPSNLVCGNGITDPEEQCDDAGTPNGSCCTSCQFRSAGALCRAVSGNCDIAETCSGASGACPSDTGFGTATVCRPSAGLCDVAETCTGFGGSCPPDELVAAGATCRAAAGGCDVAETCSGTSVDCPPDQRRSAGATCRGAAGACDVAETCSGNSTACPEDGLVTVGTVCRPAAGGCDLAETCSGSTVACPADSIASPGAVCRASAGTCDLVETCSGTSITCPPDSVLVSGAVCRPAAGACDARETCSGTSAVCPPDALRDSTTVCRAAASDCDSEERCSGSATNCPADVRAAAGTACAEDGAGCTNDVCDGAGACTHPLRPVGTVCRTAAGVCDVAETCSGSTTACPFNGFEAPGTTCRPSLGECDPAESCSGGSASCPGDAVVSAGASCAGDGIDCTIDACDGAGSCAHVQTDDDLDGTCDALDDCTNLSSLDPTAISAWKVTLSGVDPVLGVGRGKLSLTASLTLPPGTNFSALRPQSAGMRLIVDSVAGDRRIDIAIPAGTYDGTRGWKSSLGKSWSFADKGATPVGGISKAQIVDRRSRVVKVVLSGKGGTYALVPGDSPLRVRLVLGGSADAALGRCGEGVFLPGSCLASTSKVSCKQ